MVSRQFVRGRISRFRSLATRSESTSNARSKSQTLEPDFASRFSPFTTMEIVVSIPSPAARTARASFRRLRIIPIIRLVRAAWPAIDIADARSLRRALLLSPTPVRESLDWAFQIRSAYCHPLPFAPCILISSPNRLCARQLWRRTAQLHSDSAGQRFANSRAFQKARTARSATPNSEAAWESRNWLARRAFARMQHWVNQRKYPGA